MGPRKSKFLTEDFGSNSPSSTKRLKVESEKNIFGKVLPTKNCHIMKGKAKNPMMLSQGRIAITITARVMRNKRIREL